MNDGPYYIEGGEIEHVEVTVRVKNVSESTEFYKESLFLEEKEAGVFAIPHTKCYLRLIADESPGGETGITFLTDSVFTFHRKLMDENVQIIDKPTKNKEGNVEATFVDPDGNKFRVLEINQQVD